MINHFRTLLVNRSITNPLPEALEIYESPDFQQIELPDWLEMLRQILMLHKLGQLAIGIRAVQITALVNGTALRDYIECLDDRVTYNPARIPIPAEWTAQLPSLTDTLRELEQVGADVETRLFGDGTVEPYESLLQVRLKNYHTAYRLSAFAIAICYRIHECGAGNQVLAKFVAADGPPDFDYTPTGNLRDRTGRPARTIPVPRPGPAPKLA